MKIDVQLFDKQLEYFLNTLKKSEISERNKEIILDFDKDAVIKGLGKPRRIRYLSGLNAIAKVIKKDFDKTNKDDIVRFMEYLQNKDYSMWTKHGYKTVIKKFYKWLKGNDETYPEEVRWISLNVKRSEKDLPGKGDLLTEDDIKKLIDASNHPRDKAFISMLYESGCRISELANMQISNITFDKNGVVIFVKGKTGSRPIRLISSTSYLMNWLNIHPFKNDKESALWVAVGTRNHKKPMNYQGIRIQLNKIAKRSGINKRCYPHLFRHSRATYMANHLTEFQMNQYFGWVQGSSMSSTYVHMSGKDVDSAILELNGIKTEKGETKESSLKPKICSRCSTINNYDSKYCSTCAAPLDVKTAMEIEEKKKIPDEVMDKLIQDPEVQKMLIEKICSMNIKL